MNEIDSRRMNDVFFKYYHERRIENLEDIEMLDKLELAAHIEYSLRDGIAYAQATEIGKGLHGIFKP